VNEGKKVLSTVPALVAPIVGPGANPTGPKLKKWGAENNKAGSGPQNSKMGKSPRTQIKKCQEKCSARRS